MPYKILYKKYSHDQSLQDLLWQFSEVGCILGSVCVAFITKILRVDSSRANYTRSELLQDKIYIINILSNPVANSADALFNDISRMCFTFSRRVSFTKAFSAEEVLTRCAFDLSATNLTLLTNQHVLTTVSDLQPHLLI